MLTDKLYFKGITFYLVGFTEDNDRVYKSLDELRHLTIITAPTHDDGWLNASIDEMFREDEEDDMIRFFEYDTGNEIKKY